MELKESSFWEYNDDIRTVADPRGEGARGNAPIIRDFFSKVRYLMSFQIFLDSITDLSNETITFINWSCIRRLANLEYQLLFWFNTQ